MKRKIRLTESDLHRIVKESVNKILNESLVSSFNNDGEADGIDTVESFFEVMREFTYARNLVNKAIEALKKQDLYNAESLMLNVKNSLHTAIQDMMKLNNQS